MATRAVAIVGSLACLLAVAVPARAEYATSMEPGRLAVRHASWGAADACRRAWPRTAGTAVQLRMTLDRRGRVLAVETDPVVPAFARCVRGRLRTQRFSVTGPDAAGERWIVTSRYVF